MDKSVKSLISKCSKSYLFHLIWQVVQLSVTQDG